MKKISLIVITIIAAITLIACKTTEKLYAKVSLTEIDPERQAITFDIKMEDPDEQLEGALYVYINLNGTEVTNRRIALEEDVDLTAIRFTGLTVGTTYEVVITGTFLGKPVELLKTSLSTKREETKQIFTVEEFLSIDGSYTKYELMNDLDFSEETSSRRIATFRDELDGNGFAIKNYTFSNNITNAGLFGALTGTAKVYNLVIDNMEIKQETPLRTNRYAGFLVGRVNSDNVIIENITIKNSKINYNIDTTSTSSTLRIGFLTGGARGKINNITIEDTNVMNLELDRFASIFVGGLIGEVENTHKLDLTNINSAGDININVNQTGEDIRVVTESNGFADNNHTLRVGGLIGENRRVELAENLIINTNINYIEEQIYVSHKPKRTNYDIRIGGIYGRSLYGVKNALIGGNINVETGQFFVTDDQDNEFDTPIINRYINVGGFAGNYDTNGSFSKIETIVRANSNITITTDTDDETIRVANGALIGNKHSKFDANKFKLFGTITDIFNGDAFIVDDVLTITDLIAHFDNEWYTNKLSN